MCKKIHYALNLHSAVVKGLLSDDPHVKEGRHNSKLVHVTWFCHLPRLLLWMVSF